MTLFVKISDFSQIVLWRLHFPVERSAISFFYKPWVIFRHRKKNQKFSNIFSHFFSSSKFSFFRNFQINPFWKFRKFIWRFSKKIFKNFNFFFGKSVEQLLFRAEKFDFFVEILKILKKWNFENLFEDFQKKYSQIQKKNSNVTTVVTYCSGLCNYDMIIMMWTRWMTMMAVLNLSFIARQTLVQGYLVCKCILLNYCSPAAPPCSAELVLVLLRASNKLSKPKFKIV